MSRIWTTYDCPVGPLTIVSGDRGLERVSFPGAAEPSGTRAPIPELTEQLDAYFGGELRSFDVELDVEGDPFQLRVWSELRSIPYGETISYGEMATRIEENLYPQGIEDYMRPRLVGAALGRNPTAVVVPCHRVIGADGSLVGFGGGLERKRRLLELEGADLGRRRDRRRDDGQLALLQLPSRD